MLSSATQATNFAEIFIVAAASSLVIRRRTKFSQLLIHMPLGDKKASLRIFLRSQHQKMASSDAAPKRGAT